MRASFVVHSKTAVEGGTEVILRPVVNEAGTNREWSPKGTPAGELRLVVSGAMADEFVEGKRLDMDLTFPKAKADAKTPPAK